jgi:Fur family peroxide stress response transcriptional regulator
VTGIPHTEILIRQLKEAGLRVTPQRLAIYSALVTSEAHPSAQSLFEQLQPGLPSLSQATVYNTLQTLAAYGLIQEIGELGGGAVRYDGNPAPHINLVCTCCHCVTDVFDIPLDDITQQVIRRSGFDAQAIRITYYGLCSHCQKGHGAGC